ncbi:DUF4352 domain-containing protein [Streptomyces xanthochromogenes]|uniref:DUF4352 domain-containing protein n=1 Tax=Streptomyces xanthochromogenes TaxID=67384 RepID=UPI0037F3D39B
MRRLISGLAVAGALLAATACQDSSVTTTPTTAKASTGTTAGTAKASPAAAKKAAIGDTITVTGNETGEKLDVTVTKWADPAKSSEEVFAPEAGKRWVAAQLQLVNTGSAVYSDSPSNGMQVADEQGQRFGTMAADVTAGPSMAASLKVPPGDKALGWIVFEVPKDSKITTIQFAMNSGFADQTAQWAIK